MIDSVPTPVAAVATPPPTLEALNVSVGYGKKVVVHGAHVALDPGRVLALIGENGAGKTTLFRALAGQLPLMGGRVVGPEGVELTSASLSARARAGVGYVPQQVALLLDATVEANLEIASRAPGACGLSPKEAFDRVGLPDPCYGKVARALSGGQLRRLAFARLLVQGALVWLLDEPFAGLDEGGSRELVELIAQAAAGEDTSPVAVLLCEHRMDVLQSLDDAVDLRVVEVRDGVLTPPVAWHDRT